MKRVVVTGANGFIGRSLCAHLELSGWKVIAVVRPGAAIPELEPSALHQVSGLAALQEWAPLLEGAHAVVHLAARVHVMSETARNPLEEYSRVNRDGTLDLARLAAGRSVGRFVFLSTIKVNGEQTPIRPFTESDPAAPADPYAMSKWQAEQGLAEIAAATRLKIVTVRPPLVYGPRVKGNFLKLMRLVQRRVPLPLASVANLRSFIYVGNLVSALERLLAADVSNPSTFLASDDHDLSTPDLLREIGAAMGVTPRLLPCPPALLVAAARLVGRHEEARRMIESLRVDCSRLKRELRWRPPFSTTHGIAETVSWFRRGTMGTGATTE